MRQTISIGICAVLGAASTFSSAATPENKAGLRMLDGTLNSPEFIDASINEAMNVREVPGLGVAMIQDGRVVFSKAYGWRSLDPRKPLLTDTVMYGASLTKATFAYLVMQLVDEKKIALDLPIYHQLPKPLPEYPRYRDLANDPRWKKLTFRIL